jgi:hypothetical protein
LIRLNRALGGLLRRLLILKERTRSKTKCPMCGLENPEAKYRLNCSYRLVQEERERLECS